MGETEQDEEHTCETLLMCIVTVLSHGLRSGGGVGDVLRKPSKEVAWPRAAGGSLQAGWGGRLQTRRPPFRGCGRGARTPWGAQMQVCKEA